MYKVIYNIILITLLCRGNIFAQAQLTWKAVLTNTNALAFALNPLDDRIIYATGNGSFFVSHDGGEHWKTRNNLLPDHEIRTIAVCPADTSVIIIYAAQNLLRSTDGGYHWNIVLENISMDGETIEFHPEYPDTVFFVDLLSGDLWVSGDRGLNWTVRANTSLTTVCSFSINPNNPLKMIIGAGVTRIKISTDGGYTWQTVKQGNDYYSETPKIKWDPTVPDRAFGAYYLDKTYSVIKIENNGQTYTRQGIYGKDMWALDIDPTDGDIYIGTFGEINQPGVYKSYDSGESWQLLGHIPNNYIWMIKTHNDSIVYALSLDNSFGFGGIYRLDIPELGFLSGMVTDSISGLPVEYFRINEASTNDIIFSGNNTGSYTLAMLPGTYNFTFATGGMQKTLHNITINPGDTTKANLTLPLDIKLLKLAGRVTDQNNDPVLSLITLDYTDQSTATISLTDTTDKNGHFEFRNLISLYKYSRLKIEPLILPYSEKEFTSFAIDTMQNVKLEYTDVLLANGTNDESVTTLYKSVLKNNGLTGTVVNLSENSQDLDPQIISKTTKNTIIWVNRIDSTTQNIQTLDSLGKCVEAGNNIIMTGQNMIENNASHYFFKNLGIDFSGNYIIDGISDYIFAFASNPIGQNLSMSIHGPNRSPDIISFTGMNVSKALYYGNSPADSNNIAGITISNTGNTGKAIIFGFNLEIQPKQTINEIIKRSIQYFDGTLTSLQNDIVLQPDTYRLFQNYPNPFNPQTKISFVLPFKSDVELKIFDVNGREIITLISIKKLSEGMHSVQWDGKSSTGRNVASGVYFYRLKSAGFNQTKKMILIH